MTEIELKSAGIEMLIHWRAFDENGEEIAQQAVGADGVKREERRPWTLRIPLGATLGGPCVTAEVLGEHLHSEVERSREELRALLAERVRVRLPRTSENGRRVPALEHERRPAVVGEE